ncbi:MotA/TolQ/ExbB proton channel family protein [Paraglaciecola marina]|uniref:MotA/TolQ/ExbB proton channel family protein n=1 Tax=Paraglaciecola marina TaxID=2500157 RepID=UPI003B8377F5
MQLQDDKTRLERWIGAIGMTAAVSPLLGLLGTVSGMIETFKMMTLFGSGDPEVVSGGIAQALVTTELGLVVAIPALILNALLSRKAKSYYNELESFAILISKSDEQADTNEKTKLVNEPKVATQSKEKTAKQPPSVTQVSLEESSAT